ncbi:hypothetical protein RhiirA4_429792 [Rhizophagus irregularis]|uniref:Uncharacterized protein n=1 Tax=Rhizophagus irregularis TaxID=588596 RepID=A0A2I1HI48_9GLOM|nr:hypothetical protein RhiirA4_429792 [Rhizophagus irregularis]
MDHYDRYNALKAVCAIEMYTALDDLNCQYYYRKVACEERLPLSSWATLSNYSYILSENSYLFRVSVSNYNSISDDEYNNPLISSTLTKDQTLVLTWDIETYSSLGLGNFPTAQSDESNVFMICMSVHWKDDPNPLKQIYLVNVETAPDPRWTTIICRNQAEKSSLAYYLKECKLDNKLDMPFHRMFKYYGRALKETNATTAEQIRKVAEYCIIDAISCQRLMVKHNAINEYREVASVAFISLYDSHYFAVGMKVRNLLNAGAWQEAILTSTIPCEQTETGKYLGAYVFPPRAESLKESGKKLHEINFKFNGRDVLAWSIEHENQAEMKGLYPKVLEELLIRRNSLKSRHR